MALAFPCRVLQTLINWQGKAIINFLFFPTFSQCLGNTFVFLFGGFNGLVNMWENIVIGDFNKIVSSPFFLSSMFMFLLGVCLSKYSRLRTKCVRKTDVMQINRRVLISFSEQSSEFLSSNFRGPSLYIRRNCLFHFFLLNSIVSYLTNDLQGQTIHLHIIEVHNALTHYRAYFYQPLIGEFTL